MFIINFLKKNFIFKSTTNKIKSNTIKIYRTDTKYKLHCSKINKVLE